MNKLPGHLVQGLRQLVLIVVVGDVEIRATTLPRLQSPDALKRVSPLRMNRWLFRRKKNAAGDFLSRWRLTRPAFSSGCGTLLRHRTVSKNHGQQRRCKQ